MKLEEKILALIKYAEPEEPLKYVKDIIKDYAIEKINDSILGCSKCNLCSSKKRSLIFGDTKADILIVSESISEEQYNSSEEIILPLDDVDGELFYKALYVLNANKNALFIVNCVNCYPMKQIGKKEIKKTVPNAEDRQICVNNYLDKIIELIDPIIIITLGAVATNALTGDNKIKIQNDRGKKFKYKGYDVLPTYHPNYFREMKEKIDEEILDQQKENFLNDLYDAFLYAKQNRPNCKIGDIINY